MLVKDLISKLHTFHPDVVVRVMAPEDGEFHPITGFLSFNDNVSPGTVDLCSDDQEG